MALYHPRPGFWAGLVWASALWAAGLLELGCSARPLAPSAPRAALHSLPPKPAANADRTRELAPCARATRMRRSAQAMRTAGELAQALRTLDRADTLCPSSAREGRALLLDTTRELGLYRRARALAALVEAASGATAAEQRALGVLRALGEIADYGSGQTPGQLASAVDAALVQRASVTGKQALARALVALERAEAAPLVADAVRWAADTEQGAPGAWSSDGAWLALHGLDLRGYHAPPVIAILNARTWQARLRIQLAEPREGEHFDLKRSLAGLFDVGPRSAVVVEDDGVLRTVDLESGASQVARADWQAKPVQEPCPSSERLASAALSAEADLIALPWPAGGVRIFRASTGVLLATLAAPNQLQQAANDFGGPSYPCRVPGARLLRFSRDGSRLVFATPNHALKVWRPGTTQATLLATLKGAPTSLAFSPDASTVASVLYPATKVELFETNTGHRLPPLPLPEGFAPGDDVLSFVSEQSLSSVDQERVALELGQHHFAHVVGVALSSRAVAALTVQQYPARAELLLARTGQRSIAHIPVSSRSQQEVAPGSFGFDASGRYLALIQNASIALIEVSTGHCTTIPLPPAATAFSFSPSGDIVAVSGVSGGVQLWDTARAAPLRTIDTAGAQGTALAWSDDGQRLVYGTAQGALRVVEPAMGRALLPELAPASQRKIVSLSFDQSGRRLYAIDGAPSEHTWDVASGALLAAAPKARRLMPFGDPAFSVEWSKSSLDPDAQALIAHCPLPPSPGEPPRAYHGSAFPSLTPDCRAEGYLNGWNAMLAPLARPEESVELSAVEGVDALYLRGTSPEVGAPDTTHFGAAQVDSAAVGSRVRLLSGEVVTVSDPSFDGFSSVAGLGADSHLECRIGRWIFAITACQSLLLRNTLLGDASAGDPSYRDE